MPAKVVQKPLKRGTSEPEMSRTQTSHHFLPESLGSGGAVRLSSQESWLNQLSLTLKEQAPLADISVEIKYHFIDLRVHS